MVMGKVGWMEDIEGVSERMTGVLLEKYLYIQTGVDLVLLDVRGS